MRNRCFLLLLLIPLSACGASERLANVGKAPDLSKISNPAETGDYQRVSMPMPAVRESIKQKGSLWAAEKKGFFSDQRASQVGDIVNISINIKDKAKLKNKTRRTRQNDEDAQLPSLLGIEGQLSKVLPETVDSANLVNLGSSSESRGEGNVDREETVVLKLAGTVTQVLPNGNMVINGSQEVRVNFEKRILNVHGIVRPEDIDVENSIPYDKIAEARISYGGEGQITDVQQPRYGQQVYDVLFPF